MNKQIQKQKKALDSLLSADSASTDWAAEAAALLTKIKFYQHERLVHLIVTMTMSILTIIVTGILFTIEGDALIAIMLLFGLLLALTAAYLSHYFKLENHVQSLYDYYYKLQEKARKK
jgi:VIT1/CCC1 family predicted Fe2+/Mn2+ transporter